MERVHDCKTRVATEQKQEVLKKLIERSQDRAAQLASEIAATVAEQAKLEFEPAGFEFELVGVEADSAPDARDHA